jgi:N-acetylglucosaminyldiphosphoundecaprenol N-acetyl-beta-D-mannosaminyltransferase
VSVLGGAPQVEVGPFRVLDASAEEAVARVVELAARPQQRPVTVFALHVGGLNSRREGDFVDAMRDADLVYADGGSVVWLARLAGAVSIERAPTTDVGWDILSRLAERIGRRARVALIGGPPGLAARAGTVLEETGHVEVVAIEHGYQTDWVEPLAAVRDSAPDMTIVGLGAPREMLWCRQWNDHLPNGVILTCGGWFGHLTGEERRAPRPLRRSGLEWIARVAQDPARLGPRYARGVASTVSVAMMIRQRAAS